ncbi:hypothetical protein F0P96_08845 [Hymenobacter busanensis]|uniref:Uncharacterized protein n=1 Tax=Hymenobacter busanensis TaxID=2607656 RepID=A0A7L4ZZP4_9BACT|nr:hypothetical protein [Hymenobacter busanensis]KAA9333080.1 hypothetical protein F0P96_08845 [Hymenobacter busanensis]QHJ08245.1 hypothetical protein GUY19_13480 [Hymenobacter busanensis]
MRKLFHQLTADRASFPRWLGLAVLGLGLTACSGDGASDRPARRPAGYFDVPALLDAQVKQLQAQHPRLKKQVALRNGQTETAQLADVNWSNELQLFYQADINKPALRGAYQVQTADSAGLTRRTFRRQPEVDHPVIEMTVLQAGNTVRELRASLSQNNPLFFSGKRLRLRFGADGQLTDYQVRGSQKLVVFDSTRYLASGRVLR